MIDPKTITLVFIINGVDTKVRAKMNKPMRKAVESALRKSGDIARPVSDWIARDEKGVSIPQEQPLLKFHIKTGDRFFLMPFVGSGGCRRAA